jgi:hypothetical protein
MSVVGSRYQATASEDSRFKRLIICCSDLQSVEISDGTIIKRSHESC